MSKSMDNLLGMIRTWIETASGPTHMTISNPELQVRVSIRGYKKIILERTLDSTLPKKGI